MFNKKLISISLTIMALTFAFSGNSSCLSADYFPSLEVKQDYECGLINMQTFNSIPNRDQKNNLFHIGDHVIEIPVGSYEFDDISELLSNQLKRLDPTLEFTMKANNNTMKCELSNINQFKNEKSLKVGKPIYFNRSRSIGTLLGFSKRELVADKYHTLDVPVDVNKTNIICVECDIIAGSYMNGKISQTLHEFSLAASPGSKIVEVPRNVIYLPVTTKRISSLTIKLIDQTGEIIDFRGEIITTRLHLKPIS